MANKSYPNHRDVERTLNTQTDQITSLQAFDSARFADPFVTQVDSLPGCDGTNEGQLIFTTDGASGEPALCFCNSAFWARSDTTSAAADGA